MGRSTFAWHVCALGCTWIAWGCEDLVESVPTEVCASGKRWDGELTASEEMYPGQDCVGCHRENDGPELFAGGTIYGLLDPEGLRTTQNDCFGVEGARVTIRAGDGRTYQTVTNRAGNFFFEGPESSLVKPFSVVVDYTFPEGRQSREPMSTHPSYGGCARCHRPDTVPTAGATPGRELGADEIVPDVFPIFTGPVHQ